jgi:hypothetical protein
LLSQRDPVSHLAVLTLRLDNLAPDAARRVLERSGVSDNALAAGVNRIARGHPLSLQLAAGALAARPELARADVAVTPMLEELAALYLSSLDGSTRRALDAACEVRRATVSLRRCCPTIRRPTRSKRCGGCPSWTSARKGS